MKKESIPPIQESDLPFPFKEEILLNEGLRIGNPEKIFHKIHKFGMEKNESPGIFPSNHPYIKSRAFDLLHNHLGNYEENIIRMLGLSNKMKRFEYWKSRDIKSAEELSMKWVNTYSQNHFIPTINLTLKYLPKNKSLNIIELGTGTGLFSLILVDQLLKSGREKFTIISVDINVSCISFAWVVKQYFIHRDLDIHSYIFTKDNIDQKIIDSISKRHKRSIIFVVSSFSDLLDIPKNSWSDLVVSNHGTSYLNNKSYQKNIEKIHRNLRTKGLFVEDSLNEYKLDVQSKRLKKRVIFGRNRLKGEYESEYTVIQNEREIPTIVDIKGPNIDKACDWIRSMTFNPTFKSELESFRESLGKTQKTQRDLNPVAIDHSNEHEYAQRIGLKEITPKDFKTDIYMSTKIFQKV